MKRRVAVMCARQGEMSPGWYHFRRPLPPNPDEVECFRDTFSVSVHRAAVWLWMAKLPRVVTCKRYCMENQTPAVHFRGQLLPLTLSSKYSSCWYDADER